MIISFSSGFKRFFLLPIILGMFGVVSAESNSFKEICSIAGYLKNANSADELMLHIDSICAEEGSTEMARYSCNCRSGGGTCDVDRPADCKKCQTGACSNCCKAFSKIDTQGWIECMDNCCPNGYYKEERPPGSGNYHGVCYPVTIRTDVLTEH